MALLVEDAYQHVGLGRPLLDRLIQEAQQRHIRLLEGYVLYDNTPMLRLLRTSGAGRLQVRHHGGAVLAVRLLLAVPAHPPLSSVCGASSSSAPQPAARVRGALEDLSNRVRRRRADDIQ